LSEAIELGRAQQRVPAVVDRLVELADSLRRQPDATVSATLLLAAAQLAEDELGDLDRALSLCLRAQERQGPPLAVWDRLARLAHKRGDGVEAERLIALMKQWAAESGDAQAASDALLRAAAIELPRPETREAGLASLCLAVERGKDVERALALVAGMGLAPSDLVQILPLYERVARQSGDERVLFDYLERRCASTSVTVAEAREAVDLAVAVGRTERIEPLLLRLAEVASESPGGEKEATWALLELVHRRKAAGDLEAAAAALDRVADRLDPERVLSLSSELTDRATRSGNLRLAARLLEKLRVRTPEAESIWRPLLQAYLDLRDVEGLDRLVSETLPLLLDPLKRNELRLARARFLFGRDERDAGAVESLRDVMLDQPDNQDAPAMLAAYFERIGADGELIDLLEQRFERAAESKDHDQVRALAIRLGEVLERSETDRAAALYERALQLVPGQRDLLRRLFACAPAEQITAERAALMEELLGTDAGEQASQLAKNLADIWERLGDERGVLRVLEKGWALAPEPGLAGRLEQWYRDHDSWGPLAALLANEAGRQQDDNESAALLREAAVLRRERLNDVDGAVQLLLEARKRVPQDDDVLAELVQALAAKGELDAASAEVQATLSQPALPADRRMRLLLVRADLDGRRGDRRASVAALQQAYAVDQQAAFEPLQAELSTWRDEAAQAADNAGLQDATLALVTLLQERGAISEARELIEPLLHTKAADTRLLRVAVDLAETAGDLESALAAAAKLVKTTAGPADRIVAAERAAAIAERLGRPAEASGSLELALAANAGHAGLVKRLVELYERTKQTRTLALLLLDQAPHSQDDGERFERLSRAGALFMELGEATSATMALNDALMVRPNDQATTLLLSDAYLKAGALQDAASLLKPLITAHKGKASPALAVLYGQLARIAATAGDAKSELHALSRAVDADRKNGTLAAQLADRAEAAGDDELLVKALRTITLHPGNGPMSMAMALLRQARLAQRQGDKNRAMLFAKQSAQAAGQGDPVGTEARAFLSSLGVA
jgi:predicted Zn-dependent protease